MTNRQQHHDQRPADDGTHDWVPDAIPQSAIAEICHVGRILYAQQVPWAVFYRELFGVHGIIASRLRNESARRLFEDSAEYWSLHMLMRGLRETLASQRGETTVVITVRMPQAMHDALIDEAHRYRTSLNQLSITKLLAPPRCEIMPGPSHIPGDAAAAERAREQDAENS